MCVSQWGRVWSRLACDDPPGTCPLLVPRASSPVSLCLISSSLEIRAQRPFLGRVLLCRLPSGLGLCRDQEAGLCGKGRRAIQLLMTPGVSPPNCPRFHSEALPAFVRPRPAAVNDVFSAQGSSWMTSYKLWLYENTLTAKNVALRDPRARAWDAA